MESQWVGFEQRGSRRIRSGLMKVQLGGPMPQEAVEVHDVSLKGIGLKIPYALASGQELMASISHPILEDQLSLRVSVVWCRLKPGDPTPHAGLEILTSTDADRMCLRRIQAAEVSCRVLEDKRNVGFVMNQSEGRWALYNENTVKVALLVKNGRQFQVSFIGTSPDESVFELDAASLPDALAAAFELKSPPFIIPPEGGHWSAIPTAVQPKAPPRRPRPSVPSAPGVPTRDEIAPSERPPSKNKRDTSTFEAVRQASPKAFHTVKAGGYHVGYIAVTSIDDVWSLFDEAWSEVAIITPEGGSFKLSFVGKDPNDSLDFLMTKTFLGGVQMAFDLKMEPEIDPPLLAAVDPGDSSTGDSRSGDELAGQTSIVDDDDDDDEPPVGAVEPPAADESDEDMLLPQDAPSHAIMDRDMGMVGYLARAAGARDNWSVYVTTRDKVATIVKDGSRWKILFIGGNPNDSLEYMVARNFRGALALTFDLESLPTLDPPLD